MTSDTFCPPKPNEFEIAWRNLRRAPDWARRREESPDLERRIDCRGMRWCCSVKSVKTASTAPAAERVCPIIDLFEEIGSFHALTKHGGASKVFHLVVFGVACRAR